MSTHPTITPPASATPGAEPPAHFRDLLAAEWIKLRSLRSTIWTLLLVTLFVVGSAAVAAQADYSNFPNYSPLEQQTHGFSLSDAFPWVGYVTLMVIAASLGAATIVTEYSSGLIRTTTVAVPARGSVILAKAIVTATLWTLVGAVISTASFAVSQTILEGRHAAVSITDPDAFPAWLAATLIAPVCALIGLGLGVLIRHSITTTVTSIVILVMLPQLFTTRRELTAQINYTMLLSAWQRLTHAYGPPSAVGSLYGPLIESWIVYATWPLAATVLAVIVVRRRDV